MRPVEHQGLDTPGATAARRLDRLEASEAALTAAMAPEEADHPDLEAKLERLEKKLELEKESGEVTEQMTTVACDAFAIQVQILNQPLRIYL